MGEDFQNVVQLVVAETRGRPQPGDPQSSALPAAVWALGDNPNILPRTPDLNAWLLYLEGKAGSTQNCLK